jgi:hypothetical protein
MIDERTLTDATRCPSCGGPLLGSVTCPTCAVDLSGPTAQAVWQLSVQTASLLTERTRLIAALRLEATPAARAAAVTAAATAPAASAPAAWAPGTSAPGAPPVPAATPRVARPAPEWTRRKVQNLLLSLGVGLLAVAAVIFLVVSWSVLGIGGRAAIMTGATVLAGGGAVLARRRGLESTAEAVSLLAVGLALLDALGARSAGLARLDEVAGLVYWAGAFAVVAALCAATAVVLPTRSLRVAAAVLSQLSVPLLTAHLADRSDHPAAVIAAGFGVATVLAVGLVAGRLKPTRSRDVRVVFAGSAGLAWLVASLAALAAAYHEAGSLVAGTALLVALALVAACGVLAGARLPMLATAGLTASAGLVVAAAWAVPTDVVEARWLPVVLAAVAVALLGGSVAVPRLHRRAPVLVALAACVAPGFAAIIPAGAGVFVRLSWLDQPWQSGSHTSARQMLGVLRDFSVSSWGLEIPLLLACVAIALLVADRVHAIRPVALGAVPLVGLAALTLPVALDTTFASGVGIDLALALALLLPGAWLLRRGQVTWGGACSATGGVVLGLAVAWSLAAQSTTLAALATAAVVLAAMTALVGNRPSLAAPRLSLGVAATLSAVGEAAALARANGAGWPAVWSLTFGLCALAASSGAMLPLSTVVRRGFVVAATVSALGEAAALTIWGGGSPASAGLAVAVTAGALAVAGVWLDPNHAIAATIARTSTAVPTAGTSFVPTALGQDVTATAVVGAAIGVGLSALDANRLWLALLAAGVAAAVVSLRPGLPERHRVGWVAGGLLAASSWVRLVLSDVDAPEAYTVPAGAALVTLGLLRRRRDPAYSSWRAYGTGLSLALVPSLLRAVTDPGNLRPMLLGLAALVVLCSGIARRLKAPLVIGGGVLAVDAIVQLSPYLVAFYTAVPRWSVIAGTGLLLLIVGMTYERRARELQALHELISRFD